MRTGNTDSGTWMTPFVASLLACLTVPWVHAKCPAQSTLPDVPAARAAPGVSSTRLVEVLERRLAQTAPIQSGQLYGTATMPAVEYPGAGERGAVPQGQVHFGTAHPLYGPPASVCCRPGFHCDYNPGTSTWSGARPIPWEVFAQGEYASPARPAHVDEYRLRVDDRLEVVYRLSGHVLDQPYRLNVKDRLQIESLTAPEEVSRDVFVQPDGNITLPRLGQVPAAGRTVEELRGDLERRYSQDLINPEIVVTPLEFDTNLQELRLAISNAISIQGGQTRQARVTPEGTIQLPAVGSVPVQGLTLREVQREIEARYLELFEGIEVTPVLQERAPRYVYVLGEVAIPGRYTLEAPTTVLQAIALAGSWNNGAYLEQIVVLRRDDNWRLMATKLNLRGALRGLTPCPKDEIWLRDSDIVIVPKGPILAADDFIELFFTRGVYGIFPTLGFTNMSVL